MQEGSTVDQEYLAGRVRLILDYANKFGATSAAAAATEESGLNVNVRNQSLDTLEHTHDRSIGVTVYIGKSSGNASCGDMSDEGIKQTVKTAVNIAKHTAEDPCAGLPEEELLCKKPKELSLSHPWDISPEEAIEICKKAEKAGLKHDRRIINTEGASLSSDSGIFVLGNSLGFCEGYAYTNHSIGVTLIAEDKKGMQIGNWYSMKTIPQLLQDPAEIGVKAASRAVSMLSAKNLKTCKCPVIFENRAAQGLVRLLKSAVSGSNLYLKASFLTDKLGQQILPEYIDLIEDPYVKSAYGSAPFDDEGVEPHKRHVVKDGMLNGYFLSTYSAKKLGMRSTGNASGAYNLYLKAKRNHTESDLDSLIKRMGTGLLVTSLIGQGVNLTTGDYSRGAKGYWVKSGKISRPIDGVTIAGNLRDMLMNVEAVGKDVLDDNNYFCGSVLLKEMTVAGQ